MTDSSISDSFNDKSFDGTDTVLEKLKHPPPFSIRFTYLEREILRREAKGKPWSEHIRERVFGDDFTARQRGRKDMFHAQAITQALSMLGQSNIGNNLNQIAKAANRGTLPVTSDVEEELKGACADVTVMRDALISALGLQVEW